jgi:hypothetical protein
MANSSSENGIDHDVGSALCEPVWSALSHLSSKAEFIYMPRHNRLHVVNVQVERCTGAISAALPRLHAPLKSRRKWLGGWVAATVHCATNYA